MTAVVCLCPDYHFIAENREERTILPLWRSFDIWDQVNLPKKNVVVQQTKSLQPNEKQFCWLWVVVFTFFSNGEMSLAFFQVVFPTVGKTIVFPTVGKTIVFPTEWKNKIFSSQVEKLEFFQPSGKTEVFFF